MNNQPLSTLRGEIYYPAPEISRQANVPDPELYYREAFENLEAFWARRAAELEWYQPWTQVLDDSNAPFYKWFVGGKTNSVLNALDRHVKTWRCNKLALIWEGENGELRSMGIPEGDISTLEE